MQGTPTIPGLRSVPRTGVIYVSHRASELGFRFGNEEWANLGQGAPETGPLPGGSPRMTELRFTTTQHEYTPLAGEQELRERVASFYNAIYRQGKSSQYTAENVSISGGGRAALTRLAASLGNIHMGHVIPDYTAYEELLSVFKAFTPIPLLLKSASGYRITPEELATAIQGLGLGALLISNPCNPTGQHIRGEELKTWCEIARRHDCTLLFDEFYSHYVYDARAEDTSYGMVSAAAFIEDVDRDPVIIVDGLTKNWRYPGWRVSWTLGPRSVIESLASAGSFLDGGASHPMQMAAAQLLDVESTVRETAAIQRVFSAKRRVTLERLQHMGITVEHAPQGAFYCWANLSALPERLRDGMTFFEEGLKERVIVVPGVFFDVNPGKKRAATSRYNKYVRVSFGPDSATLTRGLDALEHVIAKHAS